MMNLSKSTTVLVTLSDRELSNLIYENVTQAIINLGQGGIGKVSDQNEPEIIDGKTMMERLDISEPTLQRWRNKGRIPYIQQDNVVRYNWPKVLEALEKRKGGKK